MRFRIALLWMALLMALAPQPARAVVPQPQDPDKACLLCHSDPTLQVQLQSGESLSLHVDKDRMQASVHGGRVNCVDCHMALKDAPLPHPSVRLASKREFTTRYYEACRRCHFANYTRTLDSVHFSAMEGRSGAPVCSDCHGSHYVQRSTSGSEACGRCHQAVHRAYANSVHGKAFLEGNPDVPSCTSCHGVHSIGEARSASFQLESPMLCAKCHADKNLMEKYNLSLNVLKTYLEDFHGRTVGFHQTEKKPESIKEPLCVDCHGIHDIKSAKDPASPVIQANLQKTCGRCHAGASPTFSSAWMGHYEPSWRKAPVVYAIRLYYWILIPLMMAGLLLHIGLDLGRMVRNR